MVVRRNPKAAWDRPLIEGVLGNVALLRGTTPAQRATLAARCWTKAFRKSEVISPKGERLPGILALAYGSAKLSISGGNGASRVLRFVRAGQTFGDCSALVGSAAPFEATALADCKLVVIPAEAVFSLFEHEPRCARHALLALSRRHLDLVAELEATTLRNGAQRLAAYLASLSEDPRLEAAFTVRLPASKTLVASRLDMKKETLSRLLRALSGQGLISVAGPEITVLDPASLARVAVDTAAV
ncbi:MAG: Crp/Fnr family transcriptional regulator [Clostridia bacterium]